MTRARGVPTGLVGGDVAPGFGAVADEFRRNFTERGELGAAVAATVDGETVVDLWGGTRDPGSGAPWQRDTMVPVFSSTKGMAATTVHVAHAQGLLAYDEPVATYWPEFAQAGKETVTVRQLMAHQAGLPLLDERIDLDVMADLDRLAEVLARQAPMWSPGTRHGYHGVTIGWYQGELLRRADPAGRTLGRFFAEEVARPLDVQFHIGLPDDVPDDRIARIRGISPARMVLHLHELPWRFVAALLTPGSLTARALTNPRALADTNTYNRRDVLRLEIPAGNGTGEVRALARIYGCLATGGRELGLDDETLAAMEQPAPRPSGGLRDAIMRIELVYSLGFSKPHHTDARRYRDTWIGTPAGRAFGTPGAGGSFGFADPDVRVGFAYAMNRHGYWIADDPRERSLRDALYTAL